MNENPLQENIENTKNLNENPANKKEDIDYINERNKLNIPLSQKRLQSENPFRKVYHYILDNKSRKTYSLITATFAFISILIIFAIYPTLNSISQIVKKTEEYKVINQKQKEKILNFYNLQGQASNGITNNGLNEYISFFDKTFLPDTLNVEEIFTDVINKSTNNKLEIKSLKVSDILNVNDSKNLKAGKFQVIISSLNRSDIQNMISNIANAKHFYFIQKSTIESPLVNNDTKISPDVYKYSSIITFLSLFYV